ncbi:MAG: sirohydrochlorin cobaltochelatase [Planctomycetes bacterium]|nr:sirohydrochlorin cobaltochelatase [Planctomycetota bacterium]
MSGPPPAKAILLVDHGSVKAEANELLEEIVRLVERIAPDYHVEAAHMELAPPDIADAVAACVKAGSTDITVMPYMLAPGRHSTDDIPRMALEAAERHEGVRVRVSEPLGADSRLAEIILTRVEAAREKQEEGAPGRHDR